MASPTLVLIHGFLGFSRWGPIEYFRGVRKMLLRSGIRPLIPNLPPAGSIAVRAEALARVLFSTDASAFALVGHSMGGLDARYLITHLDRDKRVKSLLTVATPHRGTPLATWFLKACGPIPTCIRYIGRPGLCELTPEARAAMPILDRDDVDYASYASCRGLDELPFWLRPYGRVIPEDNDGMVAVDSTKWGQFRGIMQADHLELIGWSIDLPDARSKRPFDHLAFWSEAAAVVIAGAANKKS
jgi:triacylglycerol lipase